MLKTIKENKMYDLMCLMGLMKEPYEDEGGAMRLGWITTSKYITSGVVSDELFQRFASIQLVKVRTVDHKSQ